MPHRWSLPLSAPGMLTLTADTAARGAGQCHRLSDDHPEGGLQEARQEACRRPRPATAAPICRSSPRSSPSSSTCARSSRSSVDWRLPPIAKDSEGHDRERRASGCATGSPQEFTEWLNSPEGGGGGFGQPEMGTDIDSCKLVSYPKDADGKNLKDKKGNDIVCPVTKADIKSMYCPAVADMILTHEGQHQIDCREQQEVLAASRPGGLAQLRRLRRARVYRRDRESAKVHRRAGEVEAVRMEGIDEQDQEDAHATASAPTRRPTSTWM